MASGPRAVARLRGGRGALAGGGVLLVVLAVAVAVLWSGAGRRDGARAVATPSATPSPSPTVSVADVYRRVAPSVAVVRTARGALGTGVVVADDGTVLSANHVIADRSALSQAALRQVAETTGGQFYRAKDAGQLQNALADLPRAITVTHRQLDLAAWFAGIGGVLVALAVALSLWWNRVRRVPAAGAAGGQTTPP